MSPCSETWRAHGALRHATSALSFRTFECDFLFQSQLFVGLISNIAFIAIYISAVFMQLNALNSFSSIAPMRALLAEPQQQMPNAGGDMRGFYEIGQPRDWWHW
jgi:hypothetical protein